jgi:GPH family glycoside/pentoside/hexuronide:cation symporter
MPRTTDGAAERASPGWGRWLLPANQLIHASGAFGFNVLFQTLTMWLVYFYAPPPEAGRAVIVPLAVLGLLLGIGRVLEAIDDAAIGHWSDMVRSRWGRRLPFIVAGTPLMVLLYLLIWQPPVTTMPWSAVYAFVVIQLYYLATTLVHQPYEAVQAEIARTPAERVRLSSWKVVFGLAGTGVGLVGSGLLIGRYGFAGMALIFGLVALASVLFSAIGIRRLAQPPPAEADFTLWDSLRTTITNRQFLVFAASEVMFFLGMNMLTQVLPFFVRVVLDAPETEVSLITALFIGAALASLPAVNWLTVRRGKAFTYQLAMALLVVMLPGLFFVGQLPGFDPLLQARLYIALLGVPMSVVFVLPNPFVADIVDDDEWRTGLRREGIYYGVEETITKAGYALSAAVFGLTLDRFGFSAAEPLGIRLIGPIAGLGILIGLAVFRLGYRLPDSIPPPPARSPAPPLSGA